MKQAIYHDAEEDYYFEDSWEEDSMTDQQWKEICDQIKREMEFNEKTWNLINEYHDDHFSVRGAREINGRYQTCMEYLQQ